MLSERKQKYIQQVKPLARLGSKADESSSEMQTHEFAPSPVDNHLVLTWELFEISKLGFVSWDRNLLQWVEQGLHLTLGSDESGIFLTDDLRFLQVCMMVTGWSDNGKIGPGAIQTAKKVGDDSDKLVSINSKGFINQHDKLNFFKEWSSINVVEFRALSVNSFSHLAKTIKNFHRFGIVIKAVQSLEKKDRNRLAYIQNFTLDFLKEFKSELCLADILDCLESKNNNDRLALIWFYFKEKATLFFDKHENDYGFNDESQNYPLTNPGIKPEFTRRDWTRHAGQMDKMFPYYDDTGSLKSYSNGNSPDALRSVHQKAPNNSLADEMRKLVIECRSQIEKIL